MSWKKHIFFQRCDSGCATFTKDMSWGSLADGKKVISAQRAFPSQIFLHSCANLCCFFFLLLFQWFIILAHFSFNVVTAIKSEWQFSTVSSEDIKDLESIILFHVKSQNNKVLFFFKDFFVMTILFLTQMVCLQLLWSLETILWTSETNKIEPLWYQITK